MNNQEIIYYIVIYIILGTLSTIYFAYDPYSRSFDWGLSNGWVFFHFQFVILWILAIILFPIILPKTISIRYSERKAVHDWRTKGTCTTKLR